MDKAALLCGEGPAAGRLSGSWARTGATTFSLWAGGQARRTGGAASQGHSESLDEALDEALHEALDRGIGSPAWFYSDHCCRISP